ncbi:hypothetical protein [Mesorhizobium sp.]|uniref:hypothetical protein n=1 Tax=Mesorhizobium sp. TaxID=1871066 RepID=UPI000FE74700|nr:hypothetical protein [Mesorhizobium sp.]RWK58474.1 MAG: hypothetical protein EOR49_31290 [Mesorhizobium sp.]RWM42773.1 MAG: hypothetical protein EOR76_32875 [Mesorhizobium sp.]RWM45376.1 MAG: hypothetical protein EOR78_34320 [Mesorhizobium sp.]RWM62522.1 MAG: hypothetical protein EOR79_03065 [Mesorhizobium sp.]RWN00129.1 MAG: hypothetical protein EOR85_16350 [Mesorhizobium sp.]
MDKNTGRSLPEWLERHLPDDPVIAWDIATKISTETQSKTGLGSSVIRKGDRNENLNEKQDEADAVVSEPYPVALLLVLSVLSIVGGAVYVVLRLEEFL